MSPVSLRPASFRPSLALPLLAAPLVLLSACGTKSSQETPAPSVEATSAAEVSTEWTVQNPTDPAVPVDLPTTRLTNAPN